MLSKCIHLSSKLLFTITGLECLAEPLPVVQAPSGHFKHKGAVDWEPQLRYHFQALCGADSRLLFYHILSQNGPFMGHLKCQRFHSDTYPLSCWFSAGNEKWHDPINRPLCYPLRKSQTVHSQNPHSVIPYQSSGKSANALSACLTQTPHSSLAQCLVGAVEAERQIATVHHEAWPGRVQQRASHLGPKSGIRAIIDDIHMGQNLNI